MHFSERDFPMKLFKIFHFKYFIDKLKFMDWTTCKALNTNPLQLQDETKTKHINILNHSQLIKFCYLVSYLYKYM